MPDVIPDLWPDDVVLSTVLSPLAILRFQAGQLRQRTKGLLEAEVQMEEKKEGRIQLSFDLIAPALDRYRYRLFTMEHDKQLVYPVRLDLGGFCFPGEFGNYLDWVDAASQDEFVRWVAEIFKCERVRSVIHSLIARSNDSSESKKSS